jgi:hypothetical protein
MIAPDKPFATGDKVYAVGVNMSRSRDTIVWLPKFAFNESAIPIVACREPDYAKQGDG